MFTPISPSFNAGAAALASSLGVVCWLLIGSYFRARARALSQLSGPPNSSLLTGNLDDVGGAPAGTRLNVWQSKYSATYRIHGPFLQPVLVLGDPCGAAHVLTNVPDYPRPEIATIVLQQWFGHSVFSAANEEHRTMRKMLNPAYTYNAVKDVSPILMDLASNSDRLDASGGSSSITLDVMKLINGFTLDAISMTSFAYKISAPATGDRPLQKLLEKFSGDGPFMGGGSALLAALAGVFPALLRLPNPLSAAAATLRAEFSRIARDVWGTDEAARCSPARILEMIDKCHGQSMSEEEAVARIVSLLFAGSETVANVLAETLHELALQPNLQERVRAELEVAREAASGELPFDALMSAKRLPLFDALCRESLRMKNPLADIARCVARDDVVPLAFPLANGSTRVPHIWGADARAFRTERWLESPADDRRDLIRAQGNLLTFGDGARVCLGRQFAITEFKTLISTLVSAFEFAPVDGVEFDFYHLAGNTVKAKVRGRENEGVQLPLQIRRVRAK